MIKKLIIIDTITLHTVNHCLSIYTHITVNVALNTSRAKCYYQSTRLKVFFFYRAYDERASEIIIRCWYRCVY